MRNAKQPYPAAVWEIWSKKKTVSLAEASFLSLDFEPDLVHCHDIIVGKFISWNVCNKDPKCQITTRYDQVVSWIDQIDGLRSVATKRSDVPEGMPVVDLCEYGSFIKRLGYSLPKNFPQSINLEKFGLKPGEKNKELTNFEKFIAVLVKFEASNDKNNLPPQKVIIDVLVELTGLDRRFCTCIARIMFPRKSTRNLKYLSNCS